MFSINLSLPILLLLVKFCYMQSDFASSDVHSDIVCCECVPFYLCENGTINTDGGGIIDVRIGGVTTPPPVVNVKVCPGPVDICCAVPNIDPSCSAQPSAPIQVVTPHPESKCECIGYDSCDPSLVVSDGLGLTSAVLSNGRTVNHSKCIHSLDVCCYLPDIFIEPGEVTTSPHIPDTGGSCECVPPFLCGADGHIKTDGAGILNVRIGPLKPLTPCPHDPELICCLPPKSEVGSPTTGQPPVTTGPRIPYKPPCGQRNINGIGVRILGFKEGQTQFGEFPWVAMLLKKSFLEGKEINVFVGGASLIHKRVVMTAAHKVANVPVEELVVRLGEYDTASTKESIPYQNVAVEQVIIHPKYFARTLFHDIALLVLKENAKEEFHIAEICPAKSLDEVIGSSCVTNGWGVDAFKSGNNQKIMKSVVLPMVDKRRCENMLRRTRLGRFFSLHESFMCAGGEEGVDACEGDGGGPLSCQRIDDPTRYLQVGITAWGIGCGGKDIPGVYVDVALHYHWIMNHVNSLFPEQLVPEAPASLSTDRKDLAREERRELRKQERKAERERKRQERRMNRENNRNNRRE